jgi:hypothetical protein
MAGKMPYRISVYRTCEIGASAEKPWITRNTIKRQTLVIASQHNKRRCKTYKQYFYQPDLNLGSSRPGQPGSQHKSKIQDYIVKLKS